MSRLDYSLLLTLFGYLKEVIKPAGHPVEHAAHRCKIIALVVSSRVSLMIHKLIPRTLWERDRLGRDKLVMRILLHKLRRLMLHRRRVLRLNLRLRVLRLDLARIGRIVLVSSKSSLIISTRESWEMIVFLSRIIPLIAAVVVWVETG